MAYWKDHEDDREAHSSGRLPCCPDNKAALAVGRLLATQFATHKFWQPSTTAGPPGAGSASGSGSAGTHSRDPLHSPSSPHINSPEPCRWNPSSHITLHSLPNAVWQECRLKATTWSSAEKISLSARSLLRCCQECAPARRNDRAAYVIVEHSVGGGGGSATQIPPLNSPVAEQTCAPTASKP